jgi:hypothetical protein
VSTLSILDKDTAREAWIKFCTNGTATPQAANLLHVGLREYLDLFEQKYLGSSGIGETYKLILGSNGEGKTHLLYCIRELALRNDHLVAMVEAKNVGAAVSPFVFGQELLSKLETPAMGSLDNDENNLFRLLKEAVNRKRGAIEAENLEVGDLLPAWAEGFREKNLSPHGLASAMADGLMSAFRNDIDGLLDAVSRICFQSAKFTKDQQQIDGAKLLKSVVKLPRMLGFRSLVLLIDEAELAIEKAGSAKRRAFLSFLRFINDHIAHGEVDKSVIMIACTDDFWPNQFEEYSGLKGRLSDPGYDNLDSRGSLTLKSLRNKNKLWVRETFRGKESDYTTLGEELLQIAFQILNGVDLDIQRKNVRTLSKVASSTEVTPWIKRPFVKALAQLVQDQVEEGKQMELSESRAREMFNLVRAGLDSEEEELPGAHRT